MADGQLDFLDQLDFTATENLRPEAIPEAAESTETAEELAVGYGIEIAPIRQDSHYSAWRPPSYEGPQCFYCGQLAGTEDHVVPKSMLEDLRLLGDQAVTAVLVRQGRVMIVDCCGDCNSRLSNVYTETLEERRGILKDKLRAKYKRLLETADWTEEELAEIGPSLRKVILARQAERALVRRRIAYKGSATYRGERIA